MKLTLIRISFGVAGLAWAGWSIFVFVFSGMGDCGDDYFCNLARDSNQAMVFWRGLAVALIIALAYRFVRKAIYVH